MNAMARGFQISRSRRNPPETVCFTDILHSRKFIYHEQLWFSQDTLHACVCVCARVCVCVWCVCVSSPNTNDLYIHYMDKSTGTPSLEEKKALPNCGNKDGNIMKNCVHT